MCSPRDGRVLVASGGVLSPHGSAELYDPVAGTFAATGSLLTARRSAQAVLLPDGKVVVAGGAGSSFTSLASAELFDPSAGSFTAAGSMAVARQNFGACWLPTRGRALVFGGATSAAAELFR